MANTTVIYEPMSDKEIEAYDRKRRAEDKISELADGFTVKPTGRTGYIYYRKGPRILEVGWEYSGDPETTIIVYTNGLRRWVCPTVEPVPADQQEDLKRELKAWIEKQGAKVDFFDPPVNEGARPK